VKTIRTVGAVREALEPFRASSIVGLVPTMGAFHAGHMSLFGAARDACDVVVASLFVNPAQFESPDDLAAYPRDEARDGRAAEEAGVDILFAPEPGEMYRPGHSTWVEVGGPARGLESEFRPGHFRGVATICVKLFSIVAPRMAFFGQKDAQQVAVLKRVVRDLNLAVDIRVLPTIRDDDGLALSSRNVRLSPAERQQALLIPRALAAGWEAYRGGRDPIAAARLALGDLTPDYLEVADFDGRPTLAVAVTIGGTRLIDNMPLDAPAGPLATASSAKGETS
jgi:pantoate--beta-alanine ligase